MGDDPRIGRYLGGGPTQCHTTYHREEAPVAILWELLLPSAVGGNSGIRV